MFKFTLYACAFLLGAALMAFEILVARMLAPNFGTDLYTWSAVISVVLFAMMVGYSIGGALVDWRPSLYWASGAAVIAGLWLLTFNLYAGPLFDALSEAFLDEHQGVLVAAFLAQFVPVVALGAYSPIAVRVALKSVQEAGRLSGNIYAVSTVGNVVGTLGAAFYLIGTFPLSASVEALGVLCLVCAAALYAAEAFFKAPQRAPADTASAETAP